MATPVSASAIPFDQPRRPMTGAERQARYKAKLKAGRRRSRPLSLPPSPSPWSR
jgi:hypothetical protein